MNYTQIKCHKGKRLLDAIDGSHINLLIKCSNAKVCPHKATCHRATQVTLSTRSEPLVAISLSVTCPHCAKRLFDISPDSTGIIAIKCEYCTKVAVIPIYNKSI